MKTKFLPIAKIKEQKIEELSLVLANIRNNIISQKNKIELLKNEFFNTTPPKTGNIKFFAQKQMLNIAYKQEENVLQSYLQQLQTEEKYLQEEIMLEQIEFEKFNFLHKEELRKKLEIAKRKESNFMDEMGSVGFTQKNKTL